MTTDAESPADGQRPSRSPSAPSTLLWLVVVVVLVAGVAGAGAALGRSSASSPRTVTVTGLGKVMGTPDTITVQLGVHTSAPTATGALEENNAKISALTASLRRHGIAAKDLQTSGLDLYPVTNSAGTVTGFSVDNSLAVTIHRVERAGATIDAAAHAVGNGIQLSGVTLSISNDSKLLAAARAKAMDNARTAADQVAAGGGAHLGAVVRIVDQENTNSYVYPVFGASSVASALRSVPIEAGSQAITVQVKVVFAL